MPTERTRAKRVPKLPRLKNEPTDAAGAARLFKRRTGFPLKADPALERAAGVALVAGLIDTVNKLERWAVAGVNYKFPSTTTTSPHPGRWLSDRGSWISSR